MKAYLKNYRQSPRKVRLVADALRGKTVTEADNILTFLTKRATGMFHKLLASAVANAQHNFKIGPDSLYVSAVSVTKGPTLKRHRPVSRGRAHRINKRTSIVTLVLSQNKPTKVKKARVAVKKK
jgi:large subunit ribosomal protein L22